MRTTINIDDETVGNLMIYTQASSKVEAIRLALTEYVRQQRKQKLLNMRGSIDIEDNWQALRELERET